MAELLRARDVDLVGHEFAYRLVQPMVDVQQLTAVMGVEPRQVEVLDAAGTVTARQGPVGSGATDVKPRTARRPEEV
jgi:hypothetical protein